MHHFKQSFLALSCLFLLGAATTANAAGFYIQEQSAKGQGDAFAGAAANPEDASTLFYNAAGMTELKTAQGAAGVALIIPSASFTNKGSAAGPLGGPFIAPTGGNSGGDPFNPTPVPSLYLAAPVKDGLWAGLAVTAPFGLANDYNPGWFGRYDSTKTMLQTVDIDPAVAYKVMPALSIGGGIDIQYANAELDNALPCQVCGLALSPATDGAAKLKGDSWAVGFNLGALWDIDNATKAGLSYRSGITQRLKGNTTISGLAMGNGTFSTSADLHLPDVVNFGLSHDFDSRLKVLGSFNWFNWHKFNNITANIANGQPAQVTTEDYRNTFAVAGGAEWKQTDQLTFRGGLQFDETPTGSFRDTRVPDSNRVWLSLGGSYAFTPAVSVDVAATHIFMPDANVNVVRNFYGALSTDVVGTTSNHVDILSLQAVAKF